MPGAGLSQFEPYSVPKTDYDRGSLLRAASLARGNEDDELFAVQRMGVNPKIAFDFHGSDGRLVATLGLKWNNLFATGALPHNCGSGASSCAYQGELVPSFRIGYHARLGDHTGFEPALKVWATATYTGVANGDDSVVFAVEPDLSSISTR